MRISDWSSDVCSSDLDAGVAHRGVDQGEQSRVLGGAIALLVGDDANDPVVEPRRGPELHGAVKGLAGADHRFLGRGLCDMGGQLCATLYKPRRHVCAMVHRLSHFSEQPPFNAAVRSEEHTSELTSLMRS